MSSFIISPSQLKQHRIALGLLEVALAEKEAKRKEKEASHLRRKAEFDRVKRENDAAAQADRRAREELKRQEEEVKRQEEHAEAEAARQVARRESEIEPRESVRFGCSMFLIEVDRFIKAASSNTPSVQIDVINGIWAYKQLLYLPGEYSDQRTLVPKCEMHETVLVLAELGYNVQLMHRYQFMHRHEGHITWHMTCVDAQAEMPHGCDFRITIQLE